jgi:hypothetical protein
MTDDKSKENEPEPFESPNSDQFGNFASALLAVLRNLETEILTYRMAQWELKTNYPGHGGAEGYFEGSLMTAQKNPRLRKIIQDRYVAFAAKFQSLQALPLPHQISTVSEFLREWKLGDSKLFSNDSPKKD